jgi:drug/metabolite transporter (DMT)-like permease
VNRFLAAALFALVAFAANSVLCRMALRQPHIDPASFTSVRLISGAVTLWLLVRLSGRHGRSGGSWRSALTLVAYAIAFSFAYVGLTAGTGALLLFGAVQVIMIAAGFIGGERIASGLGYAAWYTALPRLGAIAAANAQLAVPVIAALAGLALFDEQITVRLLAATVLVLGGTALAVRRNLSLRLARSPATK